MTERSEVAATIENLPDVLATLLAPVDPAVLVTPPAPGEWTVHEVIGHLITADGPAFRDRVARIVAGDAEIAPFDPGAPVTARDDNAASLDSLLDELRAERRRSAALVRSLRDDELTRTSAYGRYGDLAANDFVHEWPFHDHDHVQQILDVLKAAHLAGMSNAMRTALTG